MKRFSHVDKNGKANMVDVSGKKISERTASAYCEVLVSNEVFRKIEQDQITKGDVLTVAKIAGIQAAKKTSDLIPLCHNIFISKIKLRNLEPSLIEAHLLFPGIKSAILQSFRSYKNNGKRRILNPINLIALLIANIIKSSAVAHKTEINKG